MLHRVVRVVEQAAAPALVSPDMAVPVGNLPATPSTTAVGTTITTGATPHVKTAWVEIIPSIGFDVQMLGICIANTTGADATQTDALIDIGVGTAGNEEVRIANFMAGSHSITNGMSARRMIMPLGIASGSRISVRAQSLQATKSIQVGLKLWGGASPAPWYTYTYCDSYGIDVADSRGFPHTPGASGVESTWDNIETGIGGVDKTLDNNYGAFFMLLSCGAATAAASRAYHFEVGVGGTTYDEVTFGVTTTESVWGPNHTFVCPRALASGAQLQVRAESSGTAPDALDVGIYCLR